MDKIKFRAWYFPESKMYFRAYQKFFYVLLCADSGTPEGSPVRRAGYKDCHLMEFTGLYDKYDREIYEGDILRVRTGGREIIDQAGSVPDMYRSRRLHPLEDLLRKSGIARDASLEIKILGNCYEHSYLLPQAKK